MDAELDAALAVDEVDDIAAQAAPGGQKRSGEIENYNISNAKPAGYFT